MTVSLSMALALSLALKAEVEYIELSPVQLEKLSSDDFEEREGASIAIQKWSEQNLNISPELLYEAWKRNDDPEVQARCYGLMKEMLKRRKLGKGKGFLGIQMSSKILPKIPEGQAGPQAVRVDMVLPQTPAQKAGLRPGDAIFRVDELDLSSANDGLKGRQFDFEALRQAVENFSTHIKSKQPGEKVTLHFLRGGKRLEKEVILMKLDPSNDKNHDQTEAEFEAYLSRWLKDMKLGTKPK